jgi:hypothetical protein
MVSQDATSTTGEQTKETVIRGCGNEATAPSLPVISVPKPSIVSRLRCMVRFTDLTKFETFLKFATPRRPGLARFPGGAFSLANRDHLFGVRASQLTTAGEAAPFANAGEIGANGILRFRHAEGWL